MSARLELLILLAAVAPATATGGDGTTDRAHPMLNLGQLDIGGSPLSVRELHIVDYFFNDPTSTGVGIEDYGLAGIVNVCYAYMRNGGPANAVAALRHNLRFTGIRLYEGGTLDFAVNRFGRNSNAPSAEGVHSGTGMMLEWQGRRRAMLMNHIDLQSTVSVGSQFVALREVQSHPLRGANSTWTSIGGLLTYAFTKNLRLIGERGNDWAIPAAGPHRQLTKPTVAPALALKGNFWSHPDLGFRYTYASWNAAAWEAAACGAALSGAGAYSASSHGHEAGLQIEGW